METRTFFLFVPFQLDVSSEQLWREEKAIPLRPKTFAVLRYLVEHPGQLVTKDELLDVVWAGTVVSDTVLKSCIRELREALKDNVQTPQYIATVHRRGYRFIGPLSSLPSQSTALTEMVHKQGADEGKKVARKLAAILSADVKGYSRLMGEDEVATIRTLTAYREVMTLLIQQHQGRVVDSPGDNLLAEFASAVDAVHGAVAIQQELQTRNAELPDHRQMQYRIGINVGDVIVEGERIYGDGVNIAARLEALAEGGGICISGTVYDQVETKLTLKYEDLGEQTVKNIAKPVRVYRMRWDTDGESVPLPTPTPPIVSSEAAKPASRLQHRAPVLVGREAELGQLAGYWGKALNGARQLVFVTGEPGIGKTTLVEAFLASVGQQGTGPGAQGKQAQGKTRTATATEPRSLTPALWIAWGQCIEQYGAREAYMPILEALGRLCREPGGERLIALLQQHAPTWLVQLPKLLTAAELEALQRKVQGATQERMLREVAEAIDVITAEQPLILWLEDLHWSDVSTLELLSLLARRREPARLLVLGTYRPVDVIVKEHPLRAVKQELQLHGHCQELAVRLLSEEAVEEYLIMRSAADVGAQHAVPVHSLAYTIHQRTEGNPLFMVNIVNDLLTQGKFDDAAVEVSTPPTIRDMIERHLEALSSEEQHVLEVASVAGIEFSSAAVAAGIAATVDEVEQRCTALARRGQFLRMKGMAEWPDGTVAARYGFLHALYQEVTYERISAGRRSKLHHCIGERAEAAYGTQAGEIAAELAVHFEQGRDYQRAVHYLRRAGENALRRSANQEAVLAFTKGLEFLKTLPDTPERNEQELVLQVALGGAQILTKGYSAEEVERAYARARALCQHVKETPQLFWTLWGLWGFYEVRGNIGTSLELAKQLLSLAQGQQDPLLLIEAHHALGENLSLIGDLISARAYLEQGIALYDPQHGSPADSRPVSYRAAVVNCLRWAALVLWPLGYPDQALKHISEALLLVQDLADPFNQALVFDFAANVAQYRRDAPTTQQRAEAAITLSLEHGFPQLLAHGRVLRGWALVHQGQIEEGLAQLHEAIAAHGATGAALGQTYWLTLLVEAQRKGEQRIEALAMLDDALGAIHKRGKEPRDAELYRLKGELLLNAERGTQQEEQNTKKRAQSSSALHRAAFHLPHAVEAEAEACFRKAIDIAQHQQAKSLELRASTSLARLWQSKGKKQEAHKLLAEIYGWFTEGFDTKDLQEAETLLKELS